MDCNRSNFQDELKLCYKPYLEVKCFQRQNIPNAWGYITLTGFNDELEVSCENTKCILLNTIIEYCTTGSHVNTSRMADPPLLE